MPKHSIRLVAVLAFAGAGLALAGHAHAQTGSRIAARLQAAVSKIQDGCGNDLKQYCSSVTPGEGRLLLCLQAHEDKISTQCDYALFQASRNLERALDRVEMAADACGNDIEKHCSATELGEGRIMDCLVKNKASLRKACQRVVDKIEAAK